jgi:hypothetical protein
LLGTHTEALGQAAVVHHFIRALDQSSHRQNRQLPEAWIELGGMAQADPKLDQMPQQGRAVGDYPEDVIDASKLHQNVVKEPALMLGELIALAEGGVFIPRVRRSPANVLVASAATEIPGEALANLCLCRLGLCCSSSYAVLSMPGVQKPHCKA